MLVRTSRPRSIPREFNQVRKKARRIRQSWSAEERRKRLLQGRQKRTEILNLLISREDVRGQAG